MSLKEIAMELFCHFDEENRGFITQDQLLNGSVKEGPFSEFSEGQLLSIFALLDKESKGVITQSDFTDAFLTHDNFNIQDDDDDDDDDQMSDKDSDKNSCDEYYYTNNNLNNSMNRMSSWKASEDIYRLTSSQPLVIEYGSTESLPQNIINDDDGVYRSLSTEALSCYHENGFDKNFCWSRINKTNESNGLKNILKRRDSLPSDLTDRLLMREAHNMKMLVARQWYSVDQGLDRVFPAMNGLTSSLNFYDDNLKNESKNNLERLQQLDINFLESCQHQKKQQQQQQQHQQQQQTRKYNRTNPKNGINMIGSSENLSSNFRCNSCVSLRSDKFASNEDVRMPRRFLSHTNLNFVNKRKISPAYLRSSPLIQDDGFGDNAVIDNDYDDYDNYDNYVHRNNSFPATNNLSFAQRNGFIISCENVSAPVDVSVEQWETFMKKIGAVSLFAGNTKLRYLWKQIGSYQHDLMFPLEDFLKGVVEEHKCVLTKCQEVENMLNTKVEQHEKVMDSIFEEFEKTMKSELKIQEKELNDREDAIKAELKKTIGLKEMACQEAIKHANELSHTLEKTKEELFASQDSKDKSDKQCHKAVEDHFQTSSQLQIIAQENEDLKFQLKRFFEQNKELQEFVTHINTNVEYEKDKYHSVMRRYEDLLEEKEFLEANVSNLSCENVELRNLNQSLSQKLVDNAFALNVCDITPTSPTVNSIPMTSSPLKEVSKKTLVTKTMSLHDEIKEQSIESITEVDDDISSKHTIKEELENYFTDDNKSIDGESHDESTHDEIADETINATSLINSTIRFPSTVQSEFKVIFCGEANSGKTSVIHRICYNTFTPSRNSTIQMDCYRRTFPYGEDNKLHLAFWDTVGQERFSSVPPSYYRKTDVAILLYDISNEQSFKNTTKWLQTIKISTDENCLRLLVGNKLDLEKQRVVSSQNGEKLAKENDAVFLEVSAKSGANIPTLIQILSSTLVNQTEYVMIQNFFDISMMTSQKSSLRTHPCCQ